MKKLNELTIKEAYDGLKEKRFSSVELTKACLEQIKKVDKDIHACLTVEETKALGQARIADEKIARGEQEILTGIPYLVKDIIATEGIRTTAASKMLENYIPPYSATIIEKIQKQGGVILGKTNLDEFAHGASTENSAFGPTKNPHDLERVAGGSSGGSAAAVAANECVYALGTDTGGSIRHPAAYCGIVGLKPSYGRISRYGLIAMTSSTDCPGPLTKTVEDAAILLKELAGADGMDSNAANGKADDYIKEMEKDIKGLKIGIPKEFFIEGMDKGVEECVRESIKKLEKMGASIHEVSLPHTKYAVPVYYIITPAEISSNLARFDGIKFGFSLKDGENLMDTYMNSRGEGFGPETKRRIMLGTFALSSGYYDAYYLKAQKVRTLIKKELEEVLKSVDVIITPTTPDVPFRIGEQSNDPLKMYLEDIFLSSASLAGLPAMNVPCGKVGNLPVGMQIIGKSFDEAKILKVGNNFEKF